MNTGLVGFAATAPMILAGVSSTQDRAFKPETDRNASFTVTP